MASLAVGALLLMAACGFASRAAAAEAIKIGVSKLTNAGAVAIAEAKGYFTAEGLTAEVVFFDAQQPIAVGVASGDLDFGIAATTAALYSLAGQGALRIIGGGISEAPTFHYLAFVASNSAYDAGLTTVKDFAGHSIALTQMGTGLQYTLALAAEKYGFDIKTVRFLPLQSNANIASALAGGQADAAVYSSTNVLPLVARGSVKLLGWVGDEGLTFQANLMFVSTKTADDRHDTVEHFLRAYRKGAHTFHDAFTGRDEQRKDAPNAPEMVAIIAKFIGQSPDFVKSGVPYIDPDIRIDVQDVQHQIDWYRSQGLMKGEVTTDAILDKRYIIPWPGR
jgi:NitT/TauT family transport system substrate-binding protein